MIPRAFCDKTILGAFWFFLAIASPAHAEPEVDVSDLPRSQPTDPADALATFEIAPGFRLELVAAEPLVVDPIAMAFDEKRRLFVVEMRGYSERRDEKLGRIRLLTDDDGDGKFDRSSVYAKDLAWPTAVIAWDGGVFVAATPDIYYFKDVDGDGEAEMKETVFTGFGAATPRLNVQALVNNLKWGPDGRIHGATAGNGGRVHRFGNDKGKMTELRGLDFSFDPVTFDFRAENGGGQYGLTFDQRGTKYVCSNSNHIQQIKYARRYSGSPMKPARVGIAKDGPAAKVFRLSKDEPWRVVRTRWRVAGKVKGPIEGGGRASGYFTAATGIEFYRGQAFVCDAGSNLVHRKRLLRTLGNTQTIAQRPSDERESEFLASSDNWFRPVQLIGGPDGALYISDMYREVIEHPWSLPPSIKKHLDLNSGNERGRIYRVVPDGFVQTPPTDLSTVNSHELVGRIGGAKWNTIEKLLRTRADPETTAALREAFMNGSSPQSLQLLHDLGELDPAMLVGALSNPSPATCIRALILSEATDPLPELAKLKIAALAKHQNPDVRYQLALTMGLRDGEWRIPILAELLQGNTDEWIENAVLKAIGGSAGSLFDSISASAKQPSTELLISLASIIGKTGNPDEIAKVRSLAERMPDKRFQLLAAAAKDLPASKPWVDSLAEEALSLCGDSSKDIAERLGAIEFLGLSAAGSSEFATLFDSTAEPEILATIAKIHRSSEWAQRFVRRWDDFSPAGKVHAIAALESSPVELLDAIVSKKIPAHAVNGAAIDRMRNSLDPMVRVLALKIFESSAGDRGRIISEYWPASKLPGDSAKGEKIYTERCMICHRSGKQGFAYGPDVASFRSAGKQSILTNLIDPNREVPPQHALHQITLGDGSTLTGKIIDRDDDQLRLAFPAGVEQTIDTTRVKKSELLPNSPMPEGLESGLSQQNMADLLEFLTQAE